MQKLLSIVLSGLSLVACSTTRPINNHAVMELNKKPVSPNTQYFLFSGDNSINSFNAEIFYQMGILIKHGVPPEKITCYAAPPTKEIYDKDPAFFKKLSSVFKQCYIASPIMLYQHMAEVSRQSPSNVYFYFTSHGSAPINKMIDLGHAPKSALEEINRSDEISVEYANQYHLRTQVFTDDPYIYDEVFVASRRGRLLENVTITPRYLARALHKYFPTASKQIVIQACFSGGFIDSGERSSGQDPSVSDFRGLQKITVLAASRKDRPSFGCQPERNFSIFGEVYNKILENNLKEGSNLNWRKIYLEISEEVRQIESKHKIVNYSEPQLYVN